MTDLSELNKNTPVKNATEKDEKTEAELAHNRVEREAMKAAKRAGETENKDDRGEFSNIGPV